MKLLTLATLLATAVTLTACGSAKTPSKANFAKAIDQALAKNCLGVQTPVFASLSNGFPVVIEEMQSGGFKSADQVRDHNARAFAPWEALTQAGLLVATAGPVKRTFGDGTAPGRTYALTDEGRHALKAPDSTTFCAGHTRVKEVIRYTEPSTTMGATVSEARYTTEPVDVPAWATSPALQEAFPDVKAALGDTREHQATLVLTNEGWEAELSPF
jgi:hypothetical protein